MRGGSPSACALKSLVRAAAPLPPLLPPARTRGGLRAGGGKRGQGSSPAAPEADGRSPRRPPAAFRLSRRRCGIFLLRRLAEIAGEPAGSVRAGAVVSARSRPSSRRQACREAGPQSLGDGSRPPGSGRLVDWIAPAVR